jgi:hypothetical protein
MARRKEHDRYCPQAKWNRDDAIEWWDGCQTDFDCRCDLIAQVRADERAKYVLPDLPRGGDHVDWCRDLACCGCEEIADGVIAQDV